MRLLQSRASRLAARGITAAALLTVLGILFLRRSDPEPVFHDRTLSSWLDQAAYSGATSITRGEARKAIREIGTNALPHLLKLLESRYTDDDGPTMRWLKDRPWISERTRDKLGDQSMRRFRLAAEGFNALGNLATPATAELIRLAARHESTVPIDMLTTIGPPAVESLIQALTNNMVDARGTKSMKLGALYALERMKIERAVPNLLLALDDSSEQIRVKSIDALTLIKPPRTAVVSRLIRALDEPGLVVSGSAARALGAFGGAASNAIPALLRLQAVGPIRPELAEAMVKITHSISAR